MSNPDLSANDYVMDLFLSALPFIYFLFIASITPGPNNVMLTASGMNFGYKRTIPHMMGIYIGFTALLLLCAMGVGAAVTAFPPVMIGLKILGSAYLLYLTYRILTAGRVGLKEQAAEASKPLTFWEAFGFQFINPKGVVFGLAVIGLLPEDSSLPEHLIMVVIATTIACPVSINVWTLFGKMVAELFRDDKIRQIINII